LKNADEHAKLSEDIPSELMEDPLKASDVDLMSENFIEKYESEYPETTLDLKNAERTFHESQTKTENARKKFLNLKEETEKQLLDLIEVKSKLPNQSNLESFLSKEKSTKKKTLIADILETKSEEELLRILFNKENEDTLTNILHNTQKLLMILQLKNYY